MLKNKNFLSRKSGSNRPFKFFVLITIDLILIVNYNKFNRLFSRSSN